jgi:cytochrome c553
MTFPLASCTRLAAGIAALGVAACSPVETSSADRFSASGELVALSGGGAGASKACFTCHGLDGLGNGADAPRLADLNFGYLEAQLRAYGDGRRKHPVMKWVAHHLSPVERKLVSAYYAEMPYVPEDLPERPPPPLYLFGDPARGLPACASCHGVLGQGIGPANPPLGGQPAAYLKHQIEKWRRGERRNDPLNVMLRISQLLTPAEAEYLSAYAADLPGDLPNPEPPAASLEERRFDPRNDVSAPPRRAAEPGS